MPGPPWEIGLAETQQTLLLNDLRSRIAVQVDGGLRTGRDVAIGALLGADEFGFATAPLIAAGCIMMRKCHLNTCPVGVATQNPELRKRFVGQPEHVINYFFFVAEELRADHGGNGLPHGGGDDRPRRQDRHEPRHPSLEGRRRRPVTTAAQGGCWHRTFRCGNHLIAGSRAGRRAGQRLCWSIAKPPSKKAKRCSCPDPIRNLNRTVGAMLSGRIAKKYGHEGLPVDTIHINFTGVAGQSFGAWLAHGVTLDLVGDANDYVGKGLSGGRVIVRPPASVKRNPTQNIIVGNTCLYGAICWRGLFLRRCR